jgi:hypothetical protein
MVRDLGECVGARDGEDEGNDDIYYTDETGRGDK